VVIFVSFASSAEEELIVPGVVLVGLHALAVILTIAAFIFFVSHIYRNDRLSDQQKSLWTTIVLLGNVFAIPFYWWLYIWRGPTVPRSG
jgi:hypothetical protein